MFILNKNCLYKLEPLPNSNKQIIVIDNVFTNFQTLVDYVNNTAYFQSPGKDGTLYPGCRDEMPQAYYEVLGTLLANVFGYNTDIVIAKSWASKLTVKPHELHPLQTMPHYDSLLIEDMACVHYLNDSSLGGTNFYRYKQLDKLFLDKSDEAMIHQMINVNHSAKDAVGYINHSNSIFEKVYNIEAKPNRLIIYPGNILHSPEVTANVSFCKKSINSRTTINSFFKIFKPD